MARVPKSRLELRRRNRTERGKPVLNWLTVRPSEPVVPLAIPDNAGLNPLARRWYEGLLREHAAGSKRTAAWEPSDFALALFIAGAMSKQAHGNGGGQMMKVLNKAIVRLGLVVVE